MLKSIPYGPAGMELRPNRWKRMIEANERAVDRRVDTTMNDWWVNKPTRQVTHRIFA